MRRTRIGEGKERPAPGDVVEGTTSFLCERYDFIGRVMRVADRGEDMQFIEIRIDDGRTVYAWSHERMTIVQRWTGPASAVQRDHNGEWILAESGLRAA